MVEAARPSADHVADADLSGRQLGDYRLLRRLGAGAMAQIYLAEQASLRRQVALKVLRASLATDENFVRRFHREAQAAASLVHANIVQIHEVGCADGIHYIVQEYVQGMNLNELIVRKGAPDTKLAIAILRQTAAALHKAAQRGIVHRDIKPENIMLSSAGEVKVADFGLARLQGDDVGVNLTQIGFTMGTPLYMSPEQVEGKALDQRSDIYSLGVTAFHMLAGEVPFRGETALSVAVQHLNEEPERLENLRPDLPPALCRIVHKMLAKKPADRYASAQEILRDLRPLAMETQDPDDDFDDELLASDTSIALLDARLAATQQLSTLMTKAAVQAAWRRRRRVLLGGAVVVAFLGGGALAWATRPAPLLEPAGSDETPIAEKATAAEQYEYAKRVDTEDAYRSVADYFPQEQKFVRLATEQLAKLYLEKKENDQALEALDELAAAPGDPQARAFATLGQAIVLARQGKKAEADQKLREAAEQRNDFDFDFDDESRSLLRNYREVLNQQLLRALQRPGLRTGRSGPGERQRG